MSKDRGKGSFCFGASVSLFVGCMMKPAGVERKLRNVSACADSCREVPKEPPNKTHMPAA